MKHELDDYCCDGYGGSATPSCGCGGGRHNGGGMSDLETVIAAARAYAYHVEEYDVGGWPGAAREEAGAIRQACNRLEHPTEGISTEPSNTP